MMTFIVVSDFIENAMLLDMARLGKQRVEAYQIWNVITGRSTGWAHHPIVAAWRPYQHALEYYTNCIINEFIRRGGKNNLALFILPPVILMPWWCKWDRLHQSHRAMLLRKDPFFYRDKFTVQDDYQTYGYIWPHNIDYDNRDAPLAIITAPIPPELVNPVYCNAIIKSGERKGSTCNRLIKNGGVLCAIHNKNILTRI